jgi:hypothetical protein
MQSCSASQSAIEPALTDLSEKDAKPTESSMEVTEFEVRKLDRALFEIPADLKAVADVREFRQGDQRYA